MWRGTWRILMGLILIAHGLVHLLGFVVPWRLSMLSGFPYRADVLAGVAIGDAGARVLGTLWLLACLGLLSSGVSLLARRPWWRLAALASLALSLFRTVLWVQQAYAGLAIDVALILAIIVLPPIRRLVPTDLAGRGRTVV